MCTANSIPFPLPRQMQSCIFHGTSLYEVNRYVIGRWNHSLLVYPLAEQAAYASILYSNDICATLAAVEPKKENLRSSLSSARNEGNFSRSFSIESTLKMSQFFFNYSIYLYFRISGCSTTDYNNRIDQSHPIDCSPPMNSWRVNSHIVEAFICHDMTSC
jgi:hypothetical protein